MNGYRYVGISVTGGVVNGGITPSDDLSEVKVQFSPEEFDANDDDLFVLDAQSGEIAVSYDFEAEMWSDERDARLFLGNHLGTGEPLNGDEVAAIVAVNLLKESDFEGVGGGLFIVSEDRKQALRERLEGTSR